MTTSILSKQTPQKHNTSEPHVAWRSLCNTVRRLVAISGYEIVLMLRTITFWLALVLVSLLAGILAFISRNTPLYTTLPLTQLTLDSSIIFTYRLTTLLIQIVLPFLFLGIFARDRQRKVQAIIWTRQLPSTDYIMGKSIGAAILSILISIVPVLVAWILSISGSVNMQIFHPWLDLLPMLLISNILISWLALLSIYLLPPLLGSLLVATGAVLLNLIFSDSLHSIVGLNLASAYYSPSIGFGPDSLLVFYRMLFLSCIALALLGLLTLLFSWHERQGITLKKHLILPVLLVLIGLTPLWPVANAFHQSNHFNDLAIAKSQPISASTSQYHLAVMVDPMNGHVQGNASFVLTSQQSGIKTLPIALNAGLNVQHLTIQGKSATFSHPGAGWSNIDLSQTPLTQGQTVTITFTYAGTMEVSRNNYGQSTFGFSSSLTGMDNTKYLSYAGNGIAFLQGSAGQWYPLPWTQEALQLGLRPIIDTLDLNFPNNVQLLSSVGNIQHTSNEQTLHIQNHNSLPAALVAALTQTQQRTLAKGVTLYAHREFEQQQLSTYTLISQQLPAVERLLQPDRAITQLNIVIVPLLQAPVAGPGLLFYPEYQNPNINPLDVGSSRAATYRYIATPVIEAWWEDRLLNQISRDNLPSYPNLLNPESITWFYLDGNTLAPVLTQYTTALLTEQAIQPAFLHTEQQLCQQNYQDEQKQKTPTNNNLVKTIGIYYCHPATIMLYQMNNQIGSTKTLHFLQQFVAQYALQPVNMRQFIHEAGQAQGRDISKEVDPYVCAPQPGQPTQSKRQPLACLPR